MRVAHRVIGPRIVRLLRARVEGRDHVPAAGPVILAANHVSYVDNYLLSGATPRPPCFLGKAELSVGFFGWVNRSLGMVPVARGKGDWAAIQTAVGLLRAGEVVALFPEGTRSPTGELFKFRSGMARIASAAQAPVVPVGLLGTRGIWPPGERPKMRRPEAGVAVVRYGAPIAPPDESAKSRRAFTTQVREAVAELAEQPLAAGYAPIEREAPAGAGEPPAAAV